jgi:WD40 repeat protein
LHVSSPGRLRRAALRPCLVGGLAVLVGLAPSGIVAAASPPPAAAYAHFTTPDRNWVSSLAYSPDGKTLAVGSIDETFSGNRATYKGGHIYLWNVSSARTAARDASRTLTDGGGKGIIAVTFSPDGKYLAATDADGQAYIWNVARRTVITHMIDPGTGGMAAAVFCAGDTVITADLNGSAYLWSLPAAGAPVAQQKTPRATFTTAHGDVLFTVAASPDGDTVALGGYNGTIYLWNVAARTLIGTLANPHSRGVNSLAFGGHQGSIIAAGDNNGQTYLWNTPKRSLIGPLLSASVTQHAKQVAFSPAGNILATADGPGHIYIWNVATRTFIASLQYAGELGMLAVTYSPDGTTIAAGDINPRVSLWNASWLPR